MKTKNSFLLLGSIFLFVSAAISQRAKDGDFAVSTLNQVVNSYTHLIANTAAGSTSISVNNNALIGGAFSTALSAGDLILIIQMQGATINCNSYPAENGWGNYTVPDPYLWTFDWPDHIDAWGEVTNYGNAGNYEQVEVLSVSGVNTINLQCGLLNDYTASGHVQIVRVPRFNNLTVNGGSIVSSLWNGQTGGVVALEVNTLIEFNAGGLISASDKGFRGGLVDATGKSGTAGANEVRFLGSSDASEGSEKGESILGHYSELDALYSRYGIAAPANGGGGGGYQNCGGGGGSNIGSGIYTGNGVPVGYTAVWNLENPPLGGTTSPGGGRGGYALSQLNSNELVSGPNNTAWGGDMRKNNGGRGGHPLVYDSRKIFVGGGGGAGDQDSGQGGSGGRGGGIVFVTCYGIISGTGSIEANGETGRNSNPTNAPLSNTFSGRSGNDGAGGGGAGGSIYIQNALPLSSSITLSVKGGNGGNQNLAFGSLLNPNNNNDGEAGGPGGSGTGGSISFTSGSPTQLVTAGTGGITNSPHVSNFPPNGATSGFAGIGNLSTPFYDLMTTDATICDGNSANLTVTISGTLPAGSNVQWFTQQFGGSSINSGLTFNTPVLSSTVTYYVGVCPGNFRKAITVTVTSSPNLVITDPAAQCAPSSVNLMSSSITSGSDSGTLTYWTDMGATTSLSTPSAVSSSGTYYIMLDIGGGCTSVQAVSVSINSVDNASFTMSATCDGAVLSSVATTGGTFTFNAPPSDAAAINSSSGTVSGGTSGSNYSIMYTTAGACPASNVVSVTALLGDDPSFSMNPTCDGAELLSFVTSGGTFSFNSPPTDAATINASSGLVAGGNSNGTYSILYTTAGSCSASTVVSVTALTADDASFTMNGSCQGAVVSSVVVPGGVYTFSTAPLDGASINATSGTISGGTSGESYEVLYTTNGTCSSSLIQTVTATSSDDASFIMESACNGATVTSIATPGGTFSFNTPPLDGALIDAVTGAITEASSGASYDVLYSTSGACASNSTQTITSLVVDDASFTMTSTCDGATVSSVATVGGLFSFNFLPTDGASINGFTGEITNGSSSMYYEINYTTNGTCPSSDDVSLTTLASDNASFTLMPTCDGVEASVTGNNGGLFTFIILPTDGAILNANTGFVSNGNIGSSYTIQYTTNGTCPDSSVQSATVIDCSEPEIIGIIIPTAFTPLSEPNSDWEIPGLDANYPDNIVRVFNRWGNQVFDHYSSKLNPYDSNRWDGTFNNKDLPVESYYFIIDPNDSKSEPIKGIVTIIRSE